MPTTSTSTPTRRTNDWSGHPSPDIPGAHARRVRRRPGRLPAGQLYPSSADVLPRNFCRPWILLLLAERPSHGYELMELLPSLGLERLDGAMVYRTLRSLEGEGSVRSTWTASDAGPDRRCYGITPEGRARLRLWANALRESRGHIDRFLRRARPAVVWGPTEEAV